jgi:hypothetical protein
MFRSFLARHNWFVKSSPEYLGYEDYTKAKRKVYPLVRAYIRFMWFRRNDNKDLYA